MTSDQHRPTAKIYAFPTGARPPPGHQHDVLKTTAHFPPRAAAERAPKIVFGSNWYHQVAVDETWER